MTYRSLLASVLTLCLLTACGRVPPSPTLPPPPTASPTATEPASTPRPSTPILRVWVPSRFDPSQNSTLQAQLDSFAAAHPPLRIEVRVKDETTLLQSLQLTYEAAPAILPDVIALPHEEMESAAATGLLQPFDASLLDQPDWYRAAGALGRVQDSVYGLPFALDALVLGSSSPRPLANWSDVAEAGPLAFNANDASLALALYISAGGALTDDHGNPMLDESILTRILGLFAQNRVLPLNSDAEVWNAIRNGGVGAAWEDSRKGEFPSQVRVEALPGLSDTPATLVIGWVWAVTGTDAQQNALAMGLVEWLTQEDFLAAWVPPTNLLAARGTNPVLTDARPLPSAQTLSLIEPALVDAVKNVLNGTAPEAAAQRAVEQLK